MPISQEEFEGLETKLKKDFIKKYGKSSLNQMVNCGAKLPHFAAAFGDMGVLKQLQENHINFQENADADHCDLSVIHFAAQYGHPGVIRWLVKEAGVNVNAEDFSQSTAAHFAADIVPNGDGDHTDLDCLRVLKECGADFNKRDSKGQTPLHSVAREGKPEAYSQLLSFGADPDIRDIDRRRADQIAPTWKEFVCVGDIIRELYKGHKRGIHGQSSLPAAGAAGPAGASGPANVVRRQPTGGRGFSKRVRVTPAETGADGGDGKTPSERLYPSRKRDLTPFDLRKNFRNPSVER